jgi:hypothetical protein
MCFYILTLSALGGGNLETIKLKRKFGVSSYGIMTLEVE